MREINLDLIIKRHNKNSANVDEVLHVVLMLRRTGGTTVQSIIEPAVWAEQQTIPASECRLTELELIEGV